MLINFINSMMLAAECFLCIRQSCMFSSSYQQLCLWYAATNLLPGLRAFSSDKLEVQGIDLAAAVKSETKMEMLVVAWI